MIHIMLQSTIRKKDIPFHSIFFKKVINSETIYFLFFKSFKM
jgi:hypothetical protein